MQVDYAPRAQLADWFRKGWQLIPNHYYNPGDYAIVLQMPDKPMPFPESTIQNLVSRFEKKPQTLTTIQQGVRKRLACYHSKKASGLERNLGPVS